MRRIKVIISLILIFSLIATLNVHAEDIDYNWYIKKRGNCTPGFSDKTDLVREEGGYYIDQRAADNGEKIIYLTFDAGYDNGNVKRTLEILEEENVKAAFFILNNILYKNPETVVKMFENGHLVCNHTKNHKNMSTLTDVEMKDNLKFLEDLCKERTGFEMTKYFRFPEGKFSERTLKNANALGYKTFFWSLAYADWDNSVKVSEDKAVSNLINNTHPGAIILLHPTSDINVRILKKLICEWKRLGYSFGTLDSLVDRNK